MNLPFKGPVARALLVVARNLGDAVIAVSFLKHAAQDMPEVVWYVWCRPQMAFLFAELSNVADVAMSQFPMGTDKRFTVATALDLLRKVTILRRSDWVFSVDLVDDVREVTLGRLVSGGRHYSPGWPPGHPFPEMHYAPIGPFRGHLIELTPGTVNVYDAYAMFSTRLAAHLFGRDREVGLHPARRTGALPAGVPRNSPRTVGLHPFASQACKLWRTEYWRELIPALERRGHEVVLFGAPAERAQLVSLAGGTLNTNAIVTEGMSEFFSRVRTLDLLIGLDSFAVHAAYLCGVRAIMINGSNDPALFCPPGVKVLSVPADCGAQPCLNVPRCVGTVNEYMCTRDVSVATVLNEVTELLERSLDTHRMAT